MPRKKVPKVPKGCYQRGDKWQIDTSYKGIRIRDLVSTPEMAETVIKKNQTLIDEGRYLEMRRKSTVTLEQFAKRYLKWCKAEAQKAYADKERRINRVVTALGKEMLLADITAETLERYKEKRATEVGERGWTLEPATVNREIANFKHLLSKAYDWGILTENPSRRVKMLKVKNQGLRYLSGEEIEKLIGAASAYFKPMIRLAVNTGLRRGEILGLQWKAVNLKAGTIELLDQKNGDVSYVPLNPEAIKAIRSVPRRLDSPFVFCGANGQPPCDFGRAFDAIVTKAKIPKCTFHALRHTFASHLAMSGTDILTIQKLMRHKTLTMTLRYSHLADQHVRQAVEHLTFKKTEENEVKGANQVPKSHV